MKRLIRLNLACVAVFAVRALVTKRLVKPAAPAASGIETLIERLAAARLLLHASG